MTRVAAVLATMLALEASLFLPQAEAKADYDPNMYAAAVGTEVTYDAFVIGRYDDGYGPKAFAQFEQALAPYGTWISDPRFGRVWVPSAAVVGDPFTPYATNGRWVLTEYGWTWDSKWEWGWAPFHFGRWAMLDGHQWCWVPGTLWAPAWVTWRVGRHHVGWAPMPPRGMKVGRPLGTRSPWTFALATSLGAATLDVVPPRAVRPSSFTRPFRRTPDCSPSGTSRRRSPPVPTQRAAAESRCNPSQCRSRLPGQARACPSSLAAERRWRRGRGSQPARGSRPRSSLAGAKPFLSVGTRSAMS